jgi:hypothetical protein
VSTGRPPSKVGVTRAPLSLSTRMSLFTVKHRLHPRRGWVTWLWWHPTSRSKQGILTTIREHVRDARRRFGRSDVLDVLAVFCGSARSFERTLDAFSEAMHPCASRRRPSRRLSRLTTFLPSERWCASMAHMARERPCPMWPTFPLSREATTTHVSIALTSRRACTYPPISTSPAQKVGLFDCPDQRLGTHGPLVRIMVATHPAPPQKNTKRQVGLARSGVVSERFVTALPQRAFTASDVVSLSLHRGVCDTALEDEDSAHEPDRRLESLGLGARSMAECGEVGRGTSDANGGIRSFSYSAAILL